MSRVCDLGFGFGDLGFGIWDLLEERVMTPEVKGGDDERWNIKV